LQPYDRAGRFRDGGAVLVDASVEYYTFRASAAA
jgi:hypothetical protein